MFIKTLRPIQINDEMPELFFIFFIFIFLKISSKKKNPYLPTLLFFYVTPINGFF